MPRRRQQVPCSTCIENASFFPEQPGDVRLCAACIAATNSRTFGIYANKSRTAVKHASQGSLLLLKVQALATEAEKADTAVHKAEISKLETWCREMVHAINIRNWDCSLFQLASPNFRAGAIDVFAPTVTPAAHIDVFRKMTAESPEYHMSLDSVSTDLEPEGEYARVYLTIRATGRPPGLTREALGVFTWQRREGGKSWWLISHESMRTWGMNREEV